jgi:ferredoxin-NADP reductase
MKAQLIESLEIAPSTRHFTFEIPEIDLFDFVPGQFISLVHEVEGKSITRAYSLSGLPDTNRFSICLNLAPEGKLSPFLFQMQPNDAMEAKGPYGTFVFREPHHTVMVATGTGVVPFRGMLAKRLSEDLEHRYTLIFGTRYAASLLYRAEFAALAEQYSNFDFFPTLTRPEGDWTGRSGRVQAHLLDFLGKKREANVYICGLKEMVDDVRKTLKELGFERKQIVFEKYD